MIDVLWLSKHPLFHPQHSAYLPEGTDNNSVALIIKSFTRNYTLSSYKKKIPSVHFFKDFRVNLQLNLHLFVNQPHQSRHLNVAGRTKYCDWTEEHVFYKSVLLGWGAPVVQELNLDKTIMDLKIKYFGTCTSLPDSVEEIQQFPSCTLVFVNTCQL